MKRGSAPVSRPEPAIHPRAAIGRLGLVRVAVVRGASSVTPALPPPRPAFLADTAPARG